MRTPAPEIIRKSTHKHPLVGFEENFENECRILLLHVHAKYLVRFLCFAIFIAPEILKGEPYGKEVDLWSLGVILYILYVCLSPSLPLCEVFPCITHAAFPWWVGFIIWLSDESEIRRCVDGNVSPKFRTPNKRLGEECNANHRLTPQRIWTLFEYIHDHGSPRIECAILSLDLRLTPSSENSR